MSKWTEAAIGELGCVITGRTPPAGCPEAFGDAYPFVTPTDMVGRRFQTHTDRRLSIEGAELLRRVRVPAGSLMVSCIGWQLGKVAISTGDSFTNQQINTVIPDTSKVDPMFLYYHLSMRREELKRLAAGGTRTPILNKSRFEALSVALPPRNSQQKIAQVLGSLDDLIENNSQRVTILEQLARATYREWFVKFRFPGHEDVPLNDSAFGPIPQGWTVHAFDAVAEFINGFAFKPSHWGTEGRPIIKIRELKQGVTESTPRNPAEAIAKKYWVERGDLLFSWSADLGVYLWNHEPGLLNQHLFTVRPTRPGLTVAFLFYALDSAMPQFSSRAQGTTMRHIRRSALAEVEVLLPPIRLIDRFTRSVQPMHDEVSRLVRENATLEHLRELLLPRLVTGKVDIAALDLDSVVGESVA